MLELRVGHGTGQVSEPREPELLHLGTVPLATFAKVVEDLTDLEW